jgi:hypothetical protein
VAGTSYFLAQEFNDHNVRIVVIYQLVSNVGLNGCHCRHEFTPFLLGPFEERRDAMEEQVGKERANSYRIMATCRPKVHTSCQT